MTSALEYKLGPSIYRRAFFLGGSFMKKLIIYIVVTAALLYLCTISTQAQEISDPSASLKNEVQDNGFDYRVENLRKFLDKYNSPMTPYAEDLVAYADKNGLDYRLVPSISGVESTFGKHIPVNSFNAYGWANGDYYFLSWEDSIAVVSQTLKVSYIEKGAPTITKIARRYAPPSSTWAGKVIFFVEKIDSLPLNFDII